MTERPIYFPQPSADAMVRAILDGSKTQTRRPMMPQPDMSRLKQGVTLEAHRCPQLGPVHHGRAEWGLYAAPYKPSAVPVYGYRCPFGQPGDYLWVRECWRRRRGDSGDDTPLTLKFRADGAIVGIDRDSVQWETYDDWVWQPSIHMPRWASRITLVVKRVWVEHLQNISHADAISEGCHALREWDLGREDVEPPREQFHNRWDSIYAAKGDGWKENPWVWGCEFERRSR